jgi:hypothetical protein
MVKKKMAGAGVEAPLAAGLSRVGRSVAPLNASAVSSLLSALNRPRITLHDVMVEAYVRGREVEIARKEFGEEAALWIEESARLPRLALKHLLAEFESKLPE